MRTIGEEEDRVNKRTQEMSGRMRTSQGGWEPHREDEKENQGCEGLGKKSKKENHKIYFV